MPRHLTSRLVLFVVAVGVVVAIAANGLHVLAPPLDLGPGAIRAVRLLGVLLVVAGSAGLLSARRRVLGPEDRRSSPVAIGLRTAGTIMGAVAILALMNPPEIPRPEAIGAFGFGLGDLPDFGGGGGSGGAGAGSSIGGESSIRGSDRRGGGGEPVQLGDEVVGGSGAISRVAKLLPWLLLIGFALLLRRSFRPGRSFVFEVPELDPDATRDEVEEGLEHALASLTAYGPDPRGQILRAYQRLLEALASAGAPREPHEAPHEHLARVLTPLGVGPDPLHRVAGLYVLAEFGEHPVVEEHRVAAVEALEASLTSLDRASAGSSGRVVSLRGARA